MRKTTQILLATCFAALATFSSCKKEKPNTAQETPLPTGSISGNVVVPNGTTTDVNTFKVLSVLQETNVANSSYTVETYSDDFTTQIVSNADDKVVKMGYNYPGQTDHTISSRSTALALDNLIPLLFQKMHSLQLQLLLQWEQYLGILYKLTPQLQLPSASSDHIVLH